MFSMQGKPLYPAGSAAESCTLILSITHFDENAAVLTVKGTNYRTRLHMLRMLPIQPLAVSRAKLRPFISFVSNTDDLAALYALKGPQCIRPIDRRSMLYQSVSVRIAPAKRAAVLLRAPFGNKYRAAHWAFSNSFHPFSLTVSSSAENAHPQRRLCTRKKDSILLCCLKHTRYIKGHTYPRICRIIVLAGESKYS